MAWNWAITLSKTTIQSNENKWDMTYTWFFLLTALNNEIASLLCK